MLRRFSMLPLSGGIARRSFFRTAPLFNLDYQAYRTATVREAAPEFAGKAVVDGKIKDISMNDYKGKYIVLFFYPLDFTFVCPTEIVSFSDSHAEFEKLNTQVIAVSCDSHFSHLAWVETPRKKGGLGEMKIPLLSDFTKEISRDYGVLVEEQGLSLRALFVIDDKGILRHVTINDLPVGRNVDEVLRVVQAFQYADKTGDVIPCNWKPGKETMKVEAAKEYFEKNL
ncbi:peroxidoxin [Trypanosoma equiperdum]|uniref:thioredoxin-dependent peroxiredoxin n=5 Tax=Trypanozoon TaxID=39700 RepID=D6XKT6_TRYB2|nr:tryparedoxin peroxidase [Trypanosoma brucei gambiense DAL972]XP_847032.1 tryparedoxin peroxidase [Trypanosoma brucei brucei TREU927]AAG28496.1 tryparedoxin peroxidase [Trypanosoma brucei]RHW70716.1 peroxidoxin [Trypanosoma brucei equiperdum]SCU68468.1 peroxidoxin [Trypanosoma equiperdum]AAX79420.1 tryparedoxin peroxidase [Trypanosoma brucei]AAZ12966.1 tryparedoxin peroxidase [Trypanosoma brucei brucei TREU927]|eukprot:XP_011775492.1 tryparedoxin peroxidase [Trypanosoma brucei gambiense DAL972]